MTVVIGRRSSSRLGGSTTSSRFMVFEVRLIAFVWIDLVECSEKNMGAVGINGFDNLLICT